MVYYGGSTVSLYAFLMEQGRVRGGEVERVSKKGMERVRDREGEDLFFGRQAET